MIANRITRRLPGGRPFHLLLLALAASSLGDWLYNVALLALVYDRTGSPTWVAATTTARVLPMVVFGPLGGALAGRHNRRRLMIISDAVRAVLMVALAAVAIAGLPIVLVPVLCALATAAGVAVPPAVAATSARLVDDGERQRTSALRAAVGQGAVVAGPPLGALALWLAGPSLAIALNALSFLSSALAVAAIGANAAFVPGDDADGSSTGLLGDIAAGARALRGAPTAIRLIAADLLCSAVYGLLSVTLVLVGNRIGAGGSGYGLLLGAFGAGGILGAAVLGRFGGSDCWRGVLMIALILVALPLIGLGAASGLGEALVLALVGGTGMVAGEVLSETALPRMLSADALPRAYGLAFPASLAGIIVGSLIAGPLVSQLGLQGALTGAGIFVLLAGALLLRRPLITVAPVSAPSL
jgi:MFS family permease